MTRPKHPQADRIEVLAREMLRTGIAKTPCGLVASPGHPAGPRWVVHDAKGRALVFGHEIWDVAAEVVELVDTPALVEYRAERPYYMATDAHAAQVHIERQRGSSLNWFRAGWWLDERRRESAQAV